MRQNPFRTKSLRNWLTVWVYQNWVFACYYPLTILSYAIRIPFPKNINIDALPFDLSPPNRSPDNRSNLIGSSRSLGGFHFIDRSTSFHLADITTSQSAYASPVSEATIPADTSSTIYSYLSKTIDAYRKFPPQSTSDLLFKPWEHTIKEGFLTSSPSPPSQMPPFSPSSTFYTSPPRSPNRL